MGAVAPAVVAVKLLDRHELDGVHTESLEITELSESRLYASLAVGIVGEVTHKKLIYHKVVLVLDVVVIDFPIILVPVDLEGRNEAAGTSVMVFTEL